MCTNFSINFSKVDVIYCERSELSNQGTILMMCLRMYVSITLRNVVTSRRNVASMVRIRTPSVIIMRTTCRLSSTL